jgi:exosortase/archaeosortase family protein
MTLTPAHRFALSALAWSLALFAALRLSWIDLKVVGWLASTQRDLALWYGATATAPIVVDSSCSGADVIALCVAVTLSYPVAWRRRLLGAAGGTLVILALNTIRIGTLYNTASRPALFEALHIYVWPALLVVATGAYVLAWMGRVDARGAARRSGTRAPWWRFGLTALVLIGLHAAAAPWTMTSAAVLRAGVWTADAAAGVLQTAGVPAVASGNILATSRGAFQVTQECLLTPLVPIYLAAVIALPMRRRTRLWALLLALPVFFVLGILRVLVLALPPAIVSSPLFVAHGFYQLVAGLAVIAAAAAWAIARASEPGRRSQIAGRTLIATVCAIGLAMAVGEAWRALIVRLAEMARAFAPHGLMSWTIAGDVQGALPLLRGYQLGLLTGLWIALSPFRRAWRLVAALALLALTQAGLLVALGEGAAHAGLPAHPLLIRAIALAVPGILAWLFFRPRARAGSYGQFWHDVGDHFPDLGGAASTAFYRDNEIRLLSSHVPDWRGVRILKTDLWDEARNTRIMQWAASQGAEVFGIDVSEPTLRQAHEGFAPGALKAARADVRRLPFAAASFDVIYSMGTIEHFDASADAIAEMARVLKPGGQVILGVPNRLDPFLRPVLVWILWVLGHYGYGFEKSYSRLALRRMLQRAGLTVIDESGILFIPGWLRMADLAAHTRAPRLAPATRAGVRLFGWLDGRFPRLRRHGYLLASVARWPHEQASPP